ncbi:Gfo/Idh/MocA family protein [Cellulomonas fimi]|uniref:Oxidoreductase domain protein n=1 Tax=Cellulomonas fimi (strain ATCC 484 / DSM 20113 / JCM 1341 / CCUG 24087 / LMG 16345 / NBRC 15513 / NCIMB 8980 / NCTC 7547 / NRS-133) TaxID=590998 RepID=F4H325_CELFA|nr:Gfo/Idh/MocA family oxidoreductase [Cellulomonas fimi]AEE47643.1 oxidoreductase domain protein [Cellulomonas fimi ATCC 484]NNH08636.1 Gfo/Idh/MocA family oxidoreductase [Cellulomonas fimi]VEH36706.1 1,5-anhydro-D-fructose reductase [Cellulomonas fimi]
MSRDLVLPEPRTADPADAPPLRWGVLAPGYIAGRWADAVGEHTSQRLVAAGSRSLDRAGEFARKHGVERAHGSYEALVADPEIDAVYVASPHSHHLDQALLAVRAGKHVLVEKAFTRNATEARALVDAAREGGVLLMEAMWTRYLPHTDVVRQLLDDGVLGDVHRVTGDFAVRADVDPTHRLLDPALAGGVLLDLGVYPVAFASFVARHAGLGVAPTAVQATGSLTATGVDAQVSLQVAYGQAQAQLFTSMLTAAGQGAGVHGSAGHLAVDDSAYVPAGVTVTVDGRTARWDDNRVTGYGGLAFQAAAFATYVAEGRTDSPLLPLAETVRILETTDEARRQLGVVYPGE